MPTELNLRFPDANHVTVRFGPDDDGTVQLDFTNPLAEKDLRDIQWYVETYGAHSLGDADDSEAKRIAGQLSEWGKALFNAVFTQREAQRLFKRAIGAPRDIVELSIVRIMVEKVIVRVTRCGIPVVFVRYPMPRSWRRE